MALSSPSQSPAVVVREIDLTGGVPNVQSTTGAIAGQFKWGPCLERVLIANEAELVETFGAPVDSDLTQSYVTRDFLSATQFLRYSSSLVTVRAYRDSGDASDFGNAFSLVARGTTSAADSAYDADLSGRIFDSHEQGALSITNPKILNDGNFDARKSTLANYSDYLSNDSDGDGIGVFAKYHFAAKYPGEFGNSLKVSYIKATLDSTGSTSEFADSAFNAWAYKGEFDTYPSTSAAAAAVGARGDEMHIVVIDEDGKLTGSRGTVLERFPNLSVVSNAKNSEGVSIYAKDVVNTRSQYVYMFNFDSAAEVAGAGSALVDNRTYATTDAVDSAVVNASLISGGDGQILSEASFASAYDLFEDKDQVEIDFLIAPSARTQTSQVTIVNDLVATAQSTRKDCVVVTSPNRNAILNVTSDADKVTNTVTFANALTKSSYLIVDNNFLKIYDKYNDRYVDVPAASTVAGIMAATDINRAAWFSPAGSRRGQLLGITALNYSPTKGQRDTLYKAGVNPIANIPGQGALLFGDKTMLGRPSAFDRINVRRLFLILERAIGRAAEQVLFEFNDEFTRAEFVNIVEPVLREVQGRRGITDFRVVCDETNNTAEVIDRNEFKADIFIKPARSINFVTLSFVAVRTGVDFEEVVGTV